MSEMIKRVARKLGDSLYGYCDPSDTPNTWAIAMSLAKDAVECMREPTKAMIEALDKADYEMRQQGFSGIDATGCWVVMIDEALK